jgi:hypothetical protein
MRTQKIIADRLSRMTRNSDNLDLILLRNPTPDEYMYYFEIPTYCVWRFDPVNFDSRITLHRPSEETLLDLIRENQMDLDIMKVVFSTQTSFYRLDI